MVFDFNFDEEKIDEAKFRTKVKYLLSDVLAETFPGELEKQRISEHSERLNFACPYCGDSYTDNHKKRGNIYFNGYGYHCYNCGAHYSLDKFLSDFNKNIDSSEKVFLHNVNMESAKRKANSLQKAYEYCIDFDILRKYAISRNRIIKFYHLSEIEGIGNEQIKEYLDGRYQTNYKLFAYDKKLNRLFIFNMIDENNVIGFQIRNFDRDPKYVTHNLAMIYSKFGLVVENQEEFEEANKLSLCYGLYTTDFSRDIIVTEGPLDSFLLDNAMCVCGLKNQFPFELANIKYMYDYDEPGTKKSLEMAKNGDKVFMWKKYCDDSGINTLGKKLDWTDVVKIKKKRGEAILDPRNYFTESKYDLYYIA